MAKFLLPYNFVTATGKINGNAVRTSAADIAKGCSDSAARHDVFMPGTLSGELLYEIAFETMACVGGVHVAGKKDCHPRVPSQLDWYRRDGKLAIPANTVRGAIAAIAEAISQSSLRVLDDKVMTVGDYRNQGVKVKGSVFEAFSAIDPDLIPFHSGRTNLTPAELLFGVVSTDANSVGGKLAALASRVKFFDAVSDDAQAPERQLLTIQGSPHAKYPPFYYNQLTTPRAQRKSRMSLDLTQHGDRPNGRKRYVNQSPEFRGHQLYREFEGRDKSLDNQRCNAQLASTSARFYGVITFESLSESEFSLLYLSLKPGAVFRHQFGFGKALGLGCAQLKFCALGLVESSARYQKSGLESPRFSSIKVFPSCPQNSQDLGIANFLLSVAKTKTVATIKINHNLIDKHAYGQLVELGRLPDVGDPPVINPRTTIQFNAYLDTNRNSSANQGLATDDLFEWCAQNDRVGQPQVLAAVVPGKPIPELETNAPLPRPARRR
jgi:hypothetical protein